MRLPDVIEQKAGRLRAVGNRVQTDMYKVKIIDISEFHQCADTWNRFVHEMKIPTIFCKWEWIDTWLKHFGADYEPLILCVYKDGAVAGYMPLAFRKETSTGIPARVLEFCGSSEVAPDHLDIICRQDEAAPCLKAVFEFLSAEFKSWDVLEASLLTEGGNVLEFLRGDLPFDIELKQTTVAPYIDLAPGFENYMKNFDSKQRYNIRSRQKKLYDQFSFSYAACGPSEMEEGLRALFHLHEIRANRKNITTTFKGQRLFDFHRELMEKLSRNGSLWLRFIRNKEEIISALYGFSCGGHFFYYQIGINPDWERFGPGSVLIYEVIKEAFSKNCREFDFLRGSEEYKSSWTGTSRPLYRAKVYNNTLRGNISRTYFQSAGLIKKNLKRFIS